MSAAQLYQLLIVNPTYNSDRIRDLGGPNAVGLTPKQVGLRPETKLQNTDKRQFTQQFDLDAAMWYGAIITGPHSEILLKIFTLLYRAGVIYQAGAKDSNWADWADNTHGNLASLLSHGQRVMVQVPTIPKGGEALWAWLNAGDKIPSRGYATHGLAHLNHPEALIRGHKRYLDEKVGAWQSFKGHLQGRHFALNIALGGEGNRNPFSATNDDLKGTYKEIKADGLNGHVYLNYAPPSKTAVGGLLIGCENAQHGKGDNPHTKAGHGLGGAQVVSACGGKKWSSLKCGPRKEYGGLICDLLDRGPDLKWLTQGDLLRPDFLDRKTCPVPQI